MTTRDELILRLCEASEGSAELSAEVATRAGSAEHARDLLGHSTSQVTQRVYQRGAREVAILPYQKPSDAKASTPYERTRKARRAKESPPDQGDA